MLSIESQEDFITTQLEKLDAATNLNTCSFITELKNEKRLKLSIEEKVSSVDFFKTKSWDSVLRFGLYRVVQYCVCRTIKPKSAVETGVLHGLSTAFILEAVTKNALGTLYSVDLPSTFEDGPVNNDGFFETLPPNKNSGWAIPDYLSANWKLFIGDSTKLLPNIIQKVGNIDFFIHDSEHTYATMMNEFETVWENLSDGGILMADNIDTNCAFFDFCTAKNYVPIIFPPDPDHWECGDPGIRFGLVRK